MGIRTKINLAGKGPEGARRRPGRGRQGLRTALVLIVVLAMAGCDLLGGGTTPAPPPPPVTDSAAPPPPPTPVSIVDEYQRPEYPMSRRNPFQPDLDVMKPETVGPPPGEVRPTDPLEEFALSSLTLVTVISETAIPLAMFIDPTGLGHFVKEGDRIGRNSGIVASIRDNEVEVREGSEDGDPLSGAIVNVRLREVDLAVGESGLSEQEQEALRRLMQSEEGRAAVEQSYREMAPGAAASEPGTAPRPEQRDDRFPGMAPPGSTRGNP
ncbi:MAG: pilus assembly protein PilP [Bradymonadaceae bacterium]